MIIRPSNGVENNGYTSLLINGEEGTITLDDPNGTFVEQSKGNGYVMSIYWYIYGVIIRSSIIKKYGGYSWRSTANVSLFKDSGTLMNFKHDPFTIDFWIYVINGEETESGIKILIGNSRISTFTTGISIGHSETPTSTSDGIYIYNEGNTIELSSSTLDTSPYDTYHHFALVRSGGITYDTDIYSFYKDGVLLYQGTWTSETFPTGGNIDFSDVIAIYPDYVYLDEFRITKGKALWTTDFTPPNRAS